VIRHRPRAGPQAPPAEGRPTARTAIRDSRSDRLFNAFNYLILTLLLLVILYPLLYIVSASLSNGAAVLSGRVWLWPVDPTLDGYRAVFKHPRVVSGFLNSFFYASVGTLVNVALTLLAAYPLSRKDLYGGGVLIFLFVFTLLFSGGLIPTYLVVKDLGLLNTRWAMIVPTALAVWNVLITRTYFQVTIPDELLDAAQVDGASDFVFFFRVVLPLSPAIIAVNALLYAVGHWNAFFQALIYLTDPALFPLQLVLRDILIQNQLDLTTIADVDQFMARQNLAELLKYSLIVVACLPMLLIYPFAQRYFIKGMMIGSLKG
jgi:multiple sugar transport system permease protein/putative aldouronate transport system permease protein